MATNKKTIDINPDLFNTGSFSKTRKKKEKKEKTSQVPLISPNKLRDKLLKRIKEHKLKETDTESKNDNSNNSNTANNNNEDKKNIEKYSNEFNDSIEYLQTLSKQKKEQEQKIMYEKTIQKQRELLQKKTLKRPFVNTSANVSSGSQIGVPIVNLDLPDELKEPLPLVEINTQTMNQNQNTYHIRPPQDVPYGILKGGNKPTYREYLNKTQRNVIVNNPNSALVIDGYNQNNKYLNEREKRMNLLKEKMKKQAEQEEKTQIMKTLQPQNNQIETIQIQTPLLIESNTLEQEKVHAYPNPNIINNINENNENINNENINVNNVPIEKDNLNKSGNVPLRRVIKKTIRRKYTLGKSKTKNSVAVLLKDRNTRKKVIEAQKDLKRKSMNDIKNYLREHNLIKLGSNAPNDVLRKMYESAMLTGEVTNNNKDTLLYNVLNEKDEI